MKRFAAAIFAIILAIVACSCRQSEPQSAAEEKGSTKPVIVTTIFPPYDFAREITQGAAELKQLLPAGAESHTFEPTPQDIIAIQSSDLFIYVGGESDVWIDDILESMGEKAPKTLRLIDCVNAVEEAVVEGMQAAEHEHGADEHEEIEYDEHVWTSPKNAIKIVEKLEAAIEQIDSENSAAYQAHAKSYIEKLSKLDSALTSTVSSAKRKTIVVGDRFPFRYLADDYGLTYFAAFPGCSSDADAGAATVAFLTDKVREEGIPSVLYIEFSTHKVADAIAESAKVNTMLLHSCHNVSKRELDAGTCYLTLMEQNIETLKTVLN